MLVLEIFAQVQPGTFCGVERLKKELWIFFFNSRFLGKYNLREKRVRIELRVIEYHSTEFYLERNNFSLGEYLFVTLSHYFMC